MALMCLFVIAIFCVFDKLKVVGYFYSKNLFSCGVVTSLCAIPENKGLTPERYITCQ